MLVCHLMWKCHHQALVLPHRLADNLVGLLVPGPTAAGHLSVGCKESCTTAGANIIRLPTRCPGHTGAGLIPPGRLSAIGGVSLSKPHLMLRPPPLLAQLLFTWLSDLKLAIFLPSLPLHEGAQARHPGVILSTHPLWPHKMDTHHRSALKSLSIYFLPSISIIRVPWITLMAPSLPPCYYSCQTPILPHYPLVLPCLLQSILSLFHCLQNEDPPLLGAPRESDLQGSLHLHCHIYSLNHPT